MPDLPDLDALEAAAKRATPGPWLKSAHDDSDSPTFDIWAEAETHPSHLVALDIHERSAAFIAACSPDVVTALREAIEELADLAEIGIDTLSEDWTPEETGIARGLVDWARGRDPVTGRKATDA